MQQLGLKLFYLFWLLNSGFLFRGWIFEYVGNDGEKTSLLNRAKMNWFYQYTSEFGVWVFDCDSHCEFIVKRDVSQLAQIIHVTS